MGGGGLFFVLLVNYYSHSGYLVYGERPHQPRSPHTSATDHPHPSLHSSRCAAFCFVRSCGHIYHPPVFLSPIASAFGVRGVFLCRSGPAVPWLAQGGKDLFHSSSYISYFHRCLPKSIVSYLHAVCFYPLELAILLT